MSSRGVRRILVALDTSPHSEAALREAADLAERLHAELSGVFVLDNELLRLSELPVAFETGLTSATRRALDRDDMERALRLQASRAKSALEAAAKRHRLRSSFIVSRGNVVAELLAAATNADLLAMGVLGHMSGTGRRRVGSTVRGVTARATCSVLLLAPHLRDDGSLVVIFGKSPRSEQALELGIDLAKRREASLIVILFGAREDLSELGARARTTLASAQATAELDELAADAIGDLPTVLNRYRCGLLVLPRDHDLVETHEEFLSELRCPVWIST